MWPVAFNVSLDALALKLFRFSLSFTLGNGMMFIGVRKM